MSPSKIPAPLAAGLLVAASMPPWGWWPLGLAGLAAYASLARERRETAPFATGFWFAIGWFVPATAWMWFLTAPGWIVVLSLFASLHGAAGWLAARTAGSSGRRHGAALAMFHALVEVVRFSWPFGGVPLASIAIGQSGGPLAGLAPWVGAIGIGAATMWWAFGNHRLSRGAVLVVLSVVATAWDGTSSTGRSLSVTVVQGGGEQGTRAVDTDPREVVERHLAATRSLEPDDTRDMVVWPENVVNVSGRGLFADSREFAEIAAESARLDVPFVVGITESAGDGAFTNAQVVVTTDGVVTGRYDKVRRVPFGEYIPMRGVLEAVGAPVDLVPRDARPGDARGWLDVPLRDGTEVRLGVAISWEVFFSGRVNEGVVDGAGVVVNPTNGSSYTWSILQTQQIASSRLRAREQGRWVVQAAPTGFSAFISPTGEVDGRTSIGAAEVVERTVAVREGRTPFSRLGNGFFAWLLALAGAVRVARSRGYIQRSPS